MILVNELCYSGENPKITHIYSVLILCNIPFEFNHNQIISVNGVWQFPIATTLKIYNDQLYNIHANQAKYKSLNKVITRSL